MRMFLLKIKDKDNKTTPLATAQGSGPTRYIGGNRQMMH